MFDVVFDKLKVIFSCNSSCIKEKSADCIEIKLNDKQVLMLKDTHPRFQEIMGVEHSINIVGDVSLILNEQKS